MRRTIRMLAAVALVAAGYVPAHAANVDIAEDGNCRLSAVTDPTGQSDPTTESYTRAGVLAGGPLAWLDPQTGLPGTGHLTCTIQVDQDKHAGTDAAVVSGPDELAILTLPPSQASFTAAPWDDVFLCTAVTSNGVTYYWDATFQVWTTSAEADCALAIAATEEPPVSTTADCPYGTVKGDVTYSTPVTAVTGSVSWTMHLEADCAGGSAVDGHYSLTLSGQSNESCTDGTGGATVTGTGPNGSLSGIWSFTRGGIHYYGYEPRGHGHFTDSLGTHQMAWWLDLYSTADTCPIPGANIVGHGLITL